MPRILRKRLHAHISYTVFATVLAVVSIMPTVFAQTDAPPHSRLLELTADDGAAETISTTDQWKRKRQEILAGMQKAMGPLPERTKDVPFDLKITETHRGNGYDRHRVSMASPDGDRIYAFLYVPLSRRENERRPGILALHPTGAPGKEIIDVETAKPNRQYASEIAERGYVVIAPDYPSFGESADYDFTNDDYVSGTMKGITNHMRCVDYLVSRDDVDAERLGVIGHSLGGHNAMFVGVFDQRLKVIVSSCGWTPFHDYYGGKIAGWTSDRYMPRLRDVYDLDPDKVPFDFHEVVAALAPRAFFSSSPVSDSNFDVNGVKKAIPKAAEVYRLYGAEDQLQVRYPECEHDFPFDIRKEAYNFIDRVLKYDPVSSADFQHELPRIARSTPEEALKSFQIHDGFSIEIAAAEPDVVDPVAMCFDADSNMYVVEMRGYSEQADENLGRVRLLKDRDGDGRYETAVMFAEGFSWPTAICAWDGGVFVGAAPDIFYLKDVDGDGHADRNELVFTGFAKSNVQGLLNSFRWGPDNRIYGSSSSVGGDVRRADQADSEPLQLRRRDFSFDPRTRELRAESGGAQHGMCFDDAGRRFACSNSDHIQQYIFEDRYAARNPFAVAPSSRRSIAADGPQAEVYRISPVEPWRLVRTRLRAAGLVKGPVEGGGRAAGYFTGATGTTIYRGDSWPAEYRGQAFVGDVGSNIVHRKILTKNGLVFIAHRADDNVEFLASSDIWFRPAQFENGPDGNLYVLDVSREVIEHPASLPPEIKKHIDLTSGRDQGRIYRITHQDSPTGRTMPQLSGATTAELVELLAHRNAWHRETASRLLYERQDPTAISLLRNMLTNSPSDLGRRHALLALQGQGALLPEDVVGGLRDPSDLVVVAALQAAERFIGDSAAVRSEVVRMTDDDSIDVRYQVAFTLGAYHSSSQVEGLVALLKRDGANPLMRFAVATSMQDSAAEVLEQLTEDADFVQSDIASPVLVELVELVARGKQPNEIAITMKSVVNLRERNADLSTKLLQKLAESAPAAAGSDAAASLTQMTATLIDEAERTLADPKAATPQKATAVRTLGLGSFQAHGATLLALLSVNQPPELQEAAINALSRFSDTKIVDGLLERWMRWSPSLTPIVMDTVTSRAEWTIALLQAVADSKVGVADIGIGRLRVLSASPNKTVRSLAEKLLAEQGSSGRDAIVRAYAEVTQMDADADRGRVVFRKSCATCHRVEDHGNEIAPNLAAMRARGPDAILLNVLDPNREVNPQYVSYVILTKEGKMHTGLITAESANAVTIHDGKTDPQTILRSDIDEIANTRLSLMPEGFEKEITQQQMADLIEYLMTVR